MPTAPSGTAVVGFLLIPGDNKVEQKSPEADKCTIVANLLVKGKLVTLQLVFRCSFLNLVHKNS